MTKRIDAASPLIAALCDRAEPVAATLMVSRMTSAGLIVTLRLSFIDAIVTSLQMSGVAGGDEMTELLTLSYARMKIQYWPLNERGELLDPIEYGFAADPRPAP